MVRHSEAIGAWEQVFQPVMKEEKKVPIGNGFSYIETDIVPVRKFSFPKLPFWNIIESSGSSMYGFINRMAYLYEYFKTLSEKRTVTLSFRQAQQIWLSIYPHIPTELVINKPYQMLLEYFSYGLNYTPIDIGRGKSLKSL